MGDNDAEKDVKAYLDAVRQSKGFEPAGARERFKLPIKIVHIAGIAAIATVVALLYAFYTYALCGPAAAPSGGAAGYAGQVNSSGSGWDMRTYLSLGRPLSAVSYTVVAIPQWQTGTGCGPSYMVDGLTGSGYWYQTGLAFNWHCTDTNGFEFLHGVKGPAGRMVENQTLSPFDGNVNGGDRVLLSLYFENGSVVMYAQDLNTGAWAKAAYSARNATSFVNNPQEGGYFTGPMTEWYRICTVGCVVNISDPKEGWGAINSNQSRQVYVPYNWSVNASDVTGVIVTGESQEQGSGFIGQGTQSLVPGDNSGLSIYGVTAAYCGGGRFATGTTLLDDLNFVARLLGG